MESQKKARKDYSRYNNHITPVSQCIPNKQRKKGEQNSLPREIARENWLIKAFSLRQTGDVGV